MSVANGPAAYLARRLPHAVKHVPVRAQETLSYIYSNKEEPYFIVQELCESRGGRPGLSVLTSLLVSVDVKNY